MNRRGSTGDYSGWGTRGMGRTVPVPFPQWCAHGACRGQKLITRVQYNVCYRTLHLAEGLSCLPVLYCLVWSGGEGVRNVREPRAMPVSGTHRCRGVRDHHLQGLLQLQSASPAAGPRDQLPGVLCTRQKARQHPGQQQCGNSDKVGNEGHQNLCRPLQTRVHYTQGIPRARRIAGLRCVPVLC
jgi:hypothetical protein